VILLKAKFIISFASFSFFTTRQLCWQDYQIALVDKLGVFLVDIISPCFSMLVYYLRDER
jgi:hypothetical protein